MSRARVFPSPYHQIYLLVSRLNHRHVSTPTWPCDHGWHALLGATLLTLRWFHVAGWLSWGPITIVILSVIYPGSSIMIPCHCVRCQREQLSGMMISSRELTLASSTVSILRCACTKLQTCFMLSRKGASSKTWCHEDDSSALRHLLCGDQWLPQLSLSGPGCRDNLVLRCWCWPYDGEWSRHNCVSPLWSAFPHKPHDQERVLPGF